MRRIPQPTAEWGEGSRYRFLESPVAENIFAYLGDALGGLGSPFPFISAASGTESMLARLAALPPITGRGFVLRSSLVAGNAEVFSYSHLTMEIP